MKLDLALRRGIWKAALVVAAILPCEASSHAGPELVMQEGAAITAKTSSGSIVILAGRGLDRKYRWRKCELSSNMAARRSRWMGKLGIYDPAPGFGFASFFACEGISRTVVEEAQLHFETEAAAAAWLVRYATIWRNDTVWTRDGLVVAWTVNPGRDQLNADVLQLCVGGERPQALPGASDTKVSLAGSRRPCVKVPHAVYEQTRQAWAEHWRQADERRARREAQKSAKE